MLSLVVQKVVRIYIKGREILDLVIKITSLITEDNEYLMAVKACMLSGTARLTVKIASAEVAGF